MAGHQKKHGTTKRLAKDSAARKSARVNNTNPSFEQLIAVMNRLRSPRGCPWDREQNHFTLRTYLIEEAYEVLDALDASDDAKFAEELGDLLLQIVFHSQIAAEGHRFTIHDVIREIHDKMIRRHPHVFGTKSAKDAAEVLRNWEIIKQQERQAAGGPKAPQKVPASVLEGVPKSLPALLEGFQLTRKAARIGFDWDNVDGIFDKLAEEIAELRQALKSGHPMEIESELGDLLFAVVNLSRFLKVDPEIAAKRANAKFAGRFREMERLARFRGTTLAELPRLEMEALWEEAKRGESLSSQGTS